MLLARYLIEDNGNDYVFFDPTIKNSIVIVKEVFKKLIGHYTVE